ncbi:hypothetical protein PVAP13_1KG479905 [Panicum virgatum]|uniref:Uncharacterized protein n=1 Tax=Panicum virgatum TaxID=38727 RepID=A0A8T0XHZ4_PANVG|nr:hypothetical protein PVAP13_1KG479905 [Panicum virgatum]
MYLLPMMSGPCFFTELCPFLLLMLCGVMICSCLFGQLLVDPIRFMDFCTSCTNSVL